MAADTTTHVPPENQHMDDGIVGGGQSQDGVSVTQLPNHSIHCDGVAVDGAVPPRSVCMADNGHSASTPNPTSGQCTF